MINQIQYQTICDAGMYDLVTLDSSGIAVVMRMTISGGQPEKYAFMDAERMAVMIDCSMYVNGKIHRLAQNDDHRSYAERKDAK